MSGECQKCYEHCLDCKCKDKSNGVLPNACITFQGMDGCETYKIDEYTIGVRLKWISVKDRLPIKTVSVLVFDGSYIDVMEYWYDEEGKQIWFKPKYPLIKNITHWMPLPEKPR